MQVFTIKLSPVSSPKYVNIWIAIFNLVWFGENYLDCESAVIYWTMKKSSWFLANEILTSFHEAPAKDSLRAVNGVCQINFLPSFESLKSVKKWWYINPCIPSHHSSHHQLSLSSISNSSGLLSGLLCRKLGNCIKSQSGPQELFLHC